MIYDTYADSNTARQNLFGLSLRCVGKLWYGKKSGWRVKSSLPENERAAAPDGTPRGGLTSLL